MTHESDTDTDTDTDAEPSSTVLEQYEAVRQAGDCNMFDMACVRRVALERGYTELAAAAADRDSYAGILDHYQRHGRPSIAADPDDKPEGTMYDILREEAPEEMKRERDDEH